MLPWENIQRDGFPFRTVNWKSGKKQGCPLEPCHLQWDLHRGAHVLPSTFIRVLTTCCSEDCHQLVLPTFENCWVSLENTSYTPLFTAPVTQNTMDSKLTSTKPANSARTGLWAVTKGRLQWENLAQNRGRRRRRGLWGGGSWLRDPGRIPGASPLYRAKGAQVWKDPDPSAGPLRGEDISEANQVATLNVTRARTKSDHYYFTRSSSLSLRSPKIVFLKWNKN